MRRNEQIYIKIGSKENEDKLREKILEEYETVNGFDWHVCPIGWPYL
jgi:hypothetical protein